MSISLPDDNKQEMCANSCRVRALSNDNLSTEVFKLTIYQHQLKKIHMTVYRGQVNEMLYSDMDFHVVFTHIHYLFIYLLLLLLLLSSLLLLLSLLLMLLLLLLLLSL